MLALQRCCCFEQNRKRKKCKNRKQNKISIFYGLITLFSAPLCACCLCSEGYHGVLFFCCRIHNHKKCMMMHGVALFGGCSYSHFIADSSLFFVHTSLCIMHKIKAKTSRVAFCCEKEWEIWKAKSTLNREIKMRRRKQIEINWHGGNFLESETETEKLSWPVLGALAKNPNQIGDARNTQNFIRR